MNQRMTRRPPAAPASESQTILCATLGGKAMLDFLNAKQVDNRWRVPVVVDDFDKWGEEDKALQDLLRKANADSSLVFDRERRTVTLVGPRVATGKGLEGIVRNSTKFLALVVVRFQPNNSTAVARDYFGSGERVWGPERRAELKRKRPPK